MKVHEGDCIKFRQKVVLNVVPEVLPVGHCKCCGYWPHWVREECYDRQVGRNMCECNGGGVPHTRDQLNKCQLCGGWLEEVWRSKEPTRTFLRFMISRLRERSDSALGDRFELHVRHPAMVSHYNWVPPPALDGERRAYYSSSMSGRSYEAAYWLKYVTKELWMNKALFKQLMLGRFRIGTDPATTSHYVCESDVCGTNGIDRRSWEQQERPRSHRVHNRCTTDRACSCECAIKRALSDLEKNIDIADGSTPDSASGATMLAAVQQASYGSLTFEVIQKFHHASHWTSVHSDFDPMPEVADVVSVELHDGVGAPYGNANSSGTYIMVLG